MDNKQIRLAKSILESKGYKVSKKSKRLKEGNTISRGEAISIFSSEENADRKFVRYFNASFNGSTKEMTGSEVAEWLRSRRVTDYDYSESGDKITLKFETKVKGNGFDTPKNHKVRYTITSIE